MFCKNCGNNIPDGSAQCPYCGQVLMSPAQPAPPPVEIKSHLAAAILVTLFCCLPFGIVAIVYASRVSDLAASGRYDEAMSASEKANTWVIVSIILGLVGSILWFVIGFLGAMAE